MKGLATLIAGSLGGALGWWLGSFAGVMTAFFLSVIATAAAGYLCRRMMNEYLP
jgi:hypothetical protein